MAKEFVGGIRKCPQCGGVIESLQSRCPKCGHELTDVAVNKTILEIADNYRNLLEKNDREIKRRIQEYAIPNSRETFLEVFIFAYGQSYYQDAWLNKMKQVYTKARIAISDDSESLSFMKQLMDEYEVNVKKDEAERKKVEAKAAARMKLEFVRPSEELFGGIAIVAVLVQVLFVILKLTGVIEWSWFVNFIPFFLFVVSVSSWLISDAAINGFVPDLICGIPLLIVQSVFAIRKYKGSSDWSWTLSLLPLYLMAASFFSVRSPNKLCFLGIIIQVVFVILKLDGIIPWPWMITLIPLYVYGIGFIVSLLRRIFRRK